MHEPPAAPAHPSQGHGGTARLVLLPHESHGYSARESVMHTLYEVGCWPLCCLHGCASFLRLQDRASGSPS